MVVFPKQICKRFLPDEGESRSDKTFFLKTNMELEVCTSLGSMFHRRGATVYVRMRQKCEGQVCEGQECECDLSAIGQNSEMIQIVRSRSFCLQDGVRFFFFFFKLNRKLSLSLSLSLSG